MDPDGFSFVIIVAFYGVFLRPDALYLSSSSLQFAASASFTHPMLLELYYIFRIGISTNLLFINLPSYFCITNPLLT